MKLTTLRRVVLNALKEDRELRDWLAKGIAAKTGLDSISVTGAPAPKKARKVKLTLIQGGLV